MYAYAGVLNEVPKFTRWFLSSIHPDIDAEIDESFEEVESVDEDIAGIQAIVVFKDYDIVREYFENYERHVYIDYSKNEMVCIGSGTRTANVLNRYAPQLTSLELIEAVVDNVSSCGGQLSFLQFSKEEVVYDQKEIEKYLDTIEDAEFVISVKKKSFWDKVKKVFK